MSTQLLNYMLVSQDEFLVEHYTRQGSDQWFFQLALAQA